MPEYRPSLGDKLPVIDISDDAADAAIGDVGDAAWAGSGNGTVVSILKKIWATLSGTLTVSDSGDDTANTAIGAVGDAAYTTGSGSVVSILKGIYASVAGTLGFSTNAGTTSATTLRVITASDGPLNTAIGAVGDASYTSGSGSVVAILKGIFAYAALIVTPKTNVSSTALEASHVIKNSAGTLYSLLITNTKVSPQYIQLHNLTAVPADTAVPAVVIVVPASTTIGVDFATLGRSFSTGIVVCNSSTAATKTIGSADCWFDAQYS